MRDSRVHLSEGLLQEDDVRSVRHSWKTLALPSLLFGVGLVVLLIQVPWKGDAQDLMTTNMAWQSMQPARAKHFVQPVNPALFPKPVGVGQLSVSKPVWQSAQQSRNQWRVQPVAVAAPEAPPVVEKVEAPQNKEVMGEAVGVAEDKHFDLDESVLFWKDRRGSKPATDTLQEAVAMAGEIASKGTLGQQYALAHGLRTGYMATNAVLGTLAFELTKRLSGSEGLSQLMSGSAEVKDEEQGDGGGLLSRGVEPALGLLANFVLAAVLCYRQDFNYVESGLIKAPWDMFTPSHRQYTPQYAGEKTVRFINEAIGTLGRRANEKQPGIWLDSKLYPDYFKNDFHYQTDGWMSPNSAKVYETSTETLFLGRQDAMQRLSLLPLRSAASANNGAPRILEVACGTGRFATFIRDNHPTANMTLVDLSPFYLEAARENDEYWRTTRFPNENMRPPRASFVQANAEQLPFEDGSFDAVVNVYLFHEMPKEARAKAAAEMARVVAPGGIVIWTDSVQRGDLASMTTEGAKAFGKLNEPHYVDYVDSYIPDFFTDAGLECDRKWVESATKCLSFRKPMSKSVSDEAGQVQEAATVP